MAEAKRKKQAATVAAQRLRPAAERVSSALCKLGHAASDNLGSDCYLHAALGRALLLDLGIDTRQVVGFAAWRVGPGDGDIIAHSPEATGHLLYGDKGFAYHAWLECAGFIIDFTTYQLRHKATALDAADQGHTSVEWCPQFLLLERHETYSYQQVVAALGSGLAYYEPREELSSELSAGFTLDPSDLGTARLILQNPNVVVVGPMS